VLNAVKQSRFAPAQGTDGAPVAVNMVWVLARTTVTAPAQAAKVELRPLPVRLAPVAPAAVVPKPGADAPSTSLPIVPSPTA